MSCSLNAAARDAIAWEEKRKLSPSVWVHLCPKQPWFTSSVKLWKCMSCMYWGRLNAWAYYDTLSPVDWDRKERRSGKRGQRETSCVKNINIHDIQSITEHVIVVKVVVFQNNMLRGLRLQIVGSSHPAAISHFRLTLCYLTPSPRQLGTSQVLTSPQWLPVWRKIANSCSIINHKRKEK